MTEYRYDRRYRDDDVDRQSKWGALLSLLLIPLIAIGAYFAWNAYKNNKNTAFNGVVSPISKTPSPTPTQRVQVGIGGGSISNTPTISPTRVPTRTPTVSSTENRNAVSGSSTNSTNSGLQPGVGGSSMLPNGAPVSGMGGTTK